MTGICELCGTTGELEKMLYADEWLMLCSACYAKEEAKGDREYERQKEGGAFDPDDPGHERDIREE